MIGVVSAAAEAAHAGPLYDPKFWIMIALFLFIGLLVFLKVHKAIAKALDDRAAGIAAQVEEARVLKEEAQKLLADYQRRQRDAAEEAGVLIAKAEEDARLLADEAKGAVADMIERRTRLAEDKIAQAEAAAVKQVQHAAVDVAMAAAREVITRQMADDGARIVDKSIDDLDKRLH